MSDQPSNPPADQPHVTHTDPPQLVVPAQPPTPASQPQTPPPAQPPAPASNGPQNGAQDLSGLTQQIAALPEQIVSAIREAVQPPKPADTPPAQPPADQPGKKKSFGDWWFNG